jgi:hypothetical protein
VPSRGSAIIAACAALIGSPLANAQSSTTHVWFRSAEGCPDGPDFVARLAALGRSAQLANAGDPVDFVVTLGPASASKAPVDDEWMGRLERQTERGTVAIRELRAKRCEDVAASLALSLDLALAPEGTGSNEVAPAPAGKPADPPAASDPPAAPPAAPMSVAFAPATPSPPARDEVRGGSPRSPALETRPRAALRVGAHGTLLTGVAPEPMPGAAFFAALGGRGSPGVRFSLRGGYRVSSVSATELHVSVVTGRVEGCPWSWSRQPFTVEPCLALDLGGVSAEATGDGGRSDSGLWSSVAALVRAGVNLGAPWSIEAELGASLPLVRYEFGSDAGTDRLYRTEPVGFAAGLGVAWAFR